MDGDDDDGGGGHDHDADRDESEACLVLCIPEHQVYLTTTHMYSPR